MHISYNIRFLMHEILFEIYTSMLSRCETAADRCSFGGGLLLPGYIVVGVCRLAHDWTPVNNVIITNVSHESWQITVVCLNGGRR